MSDDKRRTAELFSLVARYYDQAGIEFFSRFGEDLVEFAAVRPGERVLDVGCGRGAVTIPAAERVGASGAVEAIDIAEGMVRALERDLSERGVGNARVRVGDAEAPDVPPSSFDVVLGSLVLFFLPDLAAALRAYRLALKPSGRLGFTTFGDTSPGWAAWETQLASYLPRDDPRQSQQGGKPADPLGSPSTIRATLEDAGYTDIEIDERVYPVRYGTSEAFVHWTQTTGLRAIWDSIPTDRRAQAERETIALADGLRDPSGELVEPVTVRFTKAINP